MDKWTVITIVEVVVAVLIVAGGLLYYFDVFGGEGKIVSTVTAEQCELLKSPKDKAFCYYYMALNTKEISLCGKIEKDLWFGQNFISTSRDNCYTELLENHKRNCDSIDDSSAQISCYILQAIQTKDASLCSNVKEQGEINWNQICLTAIKGSEECKDLPIPGICEGYIAIAMQDKSICKKGKESDFCYFYLSSVMEDKSICEEIDEETTFKNRCYTNLITSTLDVNLCDRLPGEYVSGISVTQICQEEVKMSKAKLKQNENLCGSSVFSWSCYQYISIIKQDKTICDKIRDIEVKESLDPLKEELVEKCYAGENK